MRCDQCKFWGDPDVTEWDFDGAGLKRCRVIKQSWDVRDEPFEGEGKSPREDYDEWQEVERMEHEALRAAKAVTQDGSSYFASIHTTGDFGCVLFVQQQEDV